MLPTLPGLPSYTAPLTVFLSPRKVYLRNEPNFCRFVISRKEDYERHRIAPWISGRGPLFSFNRGGLNIDIIYYFVEV